MFGPLGPRDNPFWMMGALGVPYRRECTGVRDARGLVAQASRDLSALSHECPHVVLALALDSLDRSLTEAVTLMDADEKKLDTRLRKVRGNASDPDWHNALAAELQRQSTLQDAIRQVLGSRSDKEKVAVLTALAQEYRYEINAAKRRPDDTRVPDPLAARDFYPPKKKGKG